MFTLSAKKIYVKFGLIHNNQFKFKTVNLIKVQDPVAMMILYNQVIGRRKAVDGQRLILVKEILAIMQLLDCGLHFYESYLLSM